MGSRRYARLQSEFEEIREGIFENLCSLRLISPTRSDNLLRRIGEHELTEYIETGSLYCSTDEETMRSLLHYSGDQVSAAVLEDGFSIGSFDLHRDLLVDIAVTLREMVGCCDVVSDLRYGRNTTVLPKLGRRRIERDEKSLDLSLQFPFDRNLDIQFQAAQLEILRQIERTRWQISTPDDAEDDGFTYRRALSWPDGDVAASLALVMRQSSHRLRMQNNNTVSVHLYFIKRTNM